MSTTYNHIRMSVVDANANVAVMYPETTGADVTIARPSGTNVPSGVGTAQALANALAASAFTNPINDSATAATSTWSSNKINTGLTNINVYVGTDGKIHFTNSAGTDSALSFNKASGTATAAQVLTGYTFSNNSGTGLDGSMTNRGAWTPSNINPGGSVTIPAGYHNGSGKVTANANQNSGTYTASSRGASLDMGANNTYRYVNTNSVPNSNSTTYTYAANSTGGTVDMGATNTYRYVNAGNVYTKGKADGVTTHTGTYTFPSNDTGGTKDLGTTHTYRYINATNVYNKGKSDEYNSAYNLSNFTKSNIIGSSYSVPVTINKEYILIIICSGGGQFNNVAPRIDTNKNGFDIIDRNTSCSPVLILRILTTASSISSKSDGMATTGNLCILILL